MSTELFIALVVILVSIIGILIIIRPHPLSTYSGDTASSRNRSARGSEINLGENR